MFMTFEDRPSDSPLIERVWRCRAGDGGVFLSVAAAHLELVVTRAGGVTAMTLRGPETRASPLPCPPGGEWIGVRLALGVHLPALPTRALLDHHDVELPVAGDEHFTMADSCWALPDFDTAERLVDRLARQGVVALDATVRTAAAGYPQPLTPRSVQRHFQRATGITHAAFRRIERARYATNLLREGVEILDTVHEAGYFDQAHMTRSLRVLIGQTPAQVSRHEAQLSFLYKTAGQE
jgi:hypothetical protein